MEAQYNYAFKMVVLGDEGVGRSHLVNRMSKDEFGSAVDGSNKKADFQMCMVHIGDAVAKLQVWYAPTKHCEMKTLERAAYRSAVGALLVYDISNPESFQSLESKWLEKLREYGDATCNKTVMIVGTKSDLGRAVEAADGKALADKHGFKFIETSAKAERSSDASNVEACFKEMATDFISAALDKATEEEAAAAEEEAAAAEKAAKLEASGISLLPKEFKVWVQFLHSPHRGWVRIVLEVNSADTFDQLFTWYKLEHQRQFHVEKFDKPTWLAITDGPAQGYSTLFDGPIAPGKYKDPVVVKDFTNTLESHNLTKETAKMLPRKEHEEEPQCIIFFLTTAFGLMTSIRRALRVVVLAQP